MDISGFVNGVYFLIIFGIMYSTCKTVELLTLDLTGDERAAGWARRSAFSFCMFLLLLALLPELLA